MTQGIEEILGTLGDILPRDLVVEGSLDFDDSLALPPEREYCARMVKKRADEFLTGRTCARRALRALGHADAALLPLANRAPAWPAGVIGSISHTTGICVAVAGAAQTYLGIGIDVEHRLAVAPKLERYIATPSEIARFATVEDWRTIAFSGKEALFKCLNPPTGLWLEFREVEVLELGADSLRMRVSPKEVEPFEVVGHYVRTERHVLSAFVVSHGWAPGQSPVS